MTGFRDYRTFKDRLGRSDAVGLCRLLQNLIELMELILNINSYRNKEQIKNLYSQISRPWYAFDSSNHQVRDYWFRNNLKSTNYHQKALQEFTFNVLHHCWPRQYCVKYGNQAIQIWVSRGYYACHLVNLNTMQTCFR